MKLSRRQLRQLIAESMGLNEAVNQFQRMATKAYYTDEDQKNNYDKLVAAVNKQELDTDLISNDVVYKLPDDLKNAMAGNFISAELNNFRRSFNLALKALDAGDVQKVGKHIQELKNNPFVTQLEVHGIAGYEQGPLSHIDTAIDISRNRKDNEAADLFLKVKEMGKVLYGLYSTLFTGYEKYLLPNQKSTSGGARTAVAKPVAKPVGWDGFISRSSDKATAKKIKDMWAKMAGKANEYGNPKDKASPGYQYYTSSYRDWQKWYRECKQRPEYMSKIGKRSGEDMNAAEVVEVLSSFEDYESTLSGPELQSEGVSRGSMYRRRYWGRY